MREIKFELEQVKVTMYGESFLITLPTWGQAEDLEDKTRGLEEKDQSKHMVEFFESLGFPKGKLKKLQTVHLKEFMEIIKPEKK